MKKDFIVPGLVGVFVGFLLVLGLAPLVTRNSMMGFGVGEVGTLNKTGDQHFIEQMIPHHEDAITMAGIALKKGQHEEIKVLARDIQRTQAEEIAKMEEWYKNWYGVEVPNVFAAMGHGTGSLHMGMMGNKHDAESLEQAKDFDKVFIEQMIPHHQMAVMMASMLEQSTNRPEMKQLARDIIEAQTQEIEHMRVWYAVWYTK